MRSPGIPVSFPGSSVQIEELSIYIKTTAIVQFTLHSILTNVLTSSKTMIRFDFYLYIFFFETKKLFVNDVHER